MSINIKSRDQLVGQQVPNVTFHTRVADSWKDVTTDELFKGKKVVVFALPGAFTPTCSSSHLPRYNELASAFKENGIDDILCVSVNDTFVMNAWAADEEAHNITMIPDGNCEFTRGMGMEVNEEAIGFGPRSWRYSMLVDDGKIVEAFIEPIKEGDPFEVSDADTMLKFVAPNWKPQESILRRNRIGQRRQHRFRTRDYRQSNRPASVHRRQIHRRQRRPRRIPGQTRLIFQLSSCQYSR